MTSFTPLPPARRAPRLLIAWAVTVLLSGCAGHSPLQALQVASGLTSQMVCIDHLQSGRPLPAVLAQRVAPLGAMRLVVPLLSVRVDADARQVHTTLAGGFATQAHHRPGQGCLQQLAGEAPPEDDGVAPPPPQPWPAPLQAVLAGPEPVTAAAPALRLAIARGFDEPAEGSAVLHTQAIVVLQHGRVVGEQYAPGIGPDTPLLGFSMSKSLVHALAGVLVQQGRLQPEAPLGWPVWAAPGDGRHAITLMHLLRQTSGLDLRQDNSGFDTNSRLLFMARDKAGFAQQQPLQQAVGQHWAYADGHFVLASQRLREAAGGPAALQQAAEQGLFAPLGMRGVTLTRDATGTLQGASMLVAPARDWARLGQLYLDDGMAGGRRLLPEGWVHAARTPTLDTGYGAGWWTNLKGGTPNPAWGVPWGFAQAPRDAFFARGFMGQFTVVVPSRGVVIVRMGVSALRGDAIGAVDRLVGEVLAALPP